MCPIIVCVCATLICIQVCVHASAANGGVYWSGGDPDYAVCLSSAWLPRTVLFYDIFPIILIIVIWQYGHSVVLFWREGDDTMAVFGGYQQWLVFLEQRVGIAIEQHCWNVCRHMFAQRDRLCVCVCVCVCVGGTCALGHTYMPIGLVN